MLNGDLLLLPAAALDAQRSEQRAAAPTYSAVPSASAAPTAAPAAPNGIVCECLIAKCLRSAEKTERPDDRTEDGTAENAAARRHRMAKLSRKTVRDSFNFQRKSLNCGRAENVFR